MLTMSFAPVRAVLPSHGKKMSHKQYLPYNDKSCHCRTIPFRTNLWETLFLEQLQIFSLLVITYYPRIIFMTIFEIKIPRPKNTLIFVGRFSYIAYIRQRRQSSTPTAWDVFFFIFFFDWLELLLWKSREQLKSESRRTNLLAIFEMRVVYPEKPLLKINPTDCLNRNIYNPNNTFSYLWIWPATSAAPRFLYLNGSRTRSLNFQTSKVSVFYLCLKFIFDFLTTY